VKVMNRLITARNPDRLFACRFGDFMAVVASMQARDRIAPASVAPLATVLAEVAPALGSRNVLDV